MLSQVTPGHLKYAEGSAVEVGKFLAKEGGPADMAVIILLWKDCWIVRGIQMVLALGGKKVISWVRAGASSLVNGALIHHV